MVVLDGLSGTMEPTDSRSERRSVMDDERVRHSCCDETVLETDGRRRELGDRGSWEGQESALGLRNGERSAERICCMAGAVPKKEQARLEEHTALPESGP